MAVVGRPFTIACSGCYSARIGLRVSVTATAFMRGTEGVDWATDIIPSVAASSSANSSGGELPYLRFTIRFLHLAVIVGAWSRTVVGYAMSNLLDTRTCLAALEERRPSPGLIHHSDRGVQYASGAYRDRLEERDIQGSMTRRGNPYDNSLVETFFKTLKHENILAFDYQTVEDVLDRLPRFLEEKHNRRRLYSTLRNVPRV